ncbi:porin, partial [Burkholderia pseudomallei]
MHKGKLMKQTTKITGLIGGAMLAIAGQQAMAQTSVTLRGVADVSLRYVCKS